MPVELMLPGRRIPAPLPPSYLALDMAFGVGNPAILGDKSRYRSHGTIVGAVPAAGVHGYCLDFDPTIPSYVEIPAAHTQLNFIAEDFSVVMRVNMDDTTISRWLFIRGREIVDGWGIRMDAGGRVRAFTWQTPATQQSMTNPGDFVIATDYTVGLTRSGASCRIYRNGVDRTALPDVHINPLTCARSAKIGVYDNLVGNPFDGKIEFCRVFRNIALTTSEHLAWHNALA